MCRLPPGFLASVCVLGDELQHLPRGQTEARTDEWGTQLPNSPSERVRDADGGEKGARNTLHERL